MINFFNGLFNFLFGGAEDNPVKNLPPSPVESAKQSEPSPAVSKKRANEYLDSDEQITECKRLAELCKMGDAEAMYDMARLWLSALSDEKKMSVENYERNPSQENWEALPHDRGTSKFQIHVMWLIRAALYGNPKAKDIFDRCDFYNYCSAFIPYGYYVKPYSENSMPFVYSDLFYDAGLCDMIRGKGPRCILTFYRNDGYFKVSYISYYEPPDDEGFGSESEYDEVFYDEFFRAIPVRTNAPREEVLAALKDIEAEREAYWEKQEDRAARKYTKSLKNLI